MEIEPPSTEELLRAMDIICWARKNGKIEEHYSCKDCGSKNILIFDE
jgi:hypothetical protein